ncbi:hypothetical protein PTKIN_Ptkin02bG0104200 [Pterospermum kingtungense]
MQNDSCSIVYGDQAPKQPNDHQSDGVYSSFAAAASLYALHHPRLLMQQHQDMINRHNLCLTRLRQAAKEAEALRLENTSLRSVNRDLNKQLSALIHLASSDYNTTPFELVNALRGISLSGDGIGEEEVSDESPTSVIGGAVHLERVMLPKSISVRSNGYLKMMSQAGVSHRGRTRGPTRTGNSSQLSGAVSFFSLFFFSHTHSLTSRG